ncbi:ankyrin repeat-containing protein BDA1-like [Herrania umbratica]|uniref:Ankyrin repeat-containing protein BDA1-like n=1 Tax=Herrania umbratica TaxID=108875 RepID=A0A6J0ZQY5_9ROSI|nr:ankyrin repeat-containing protein BDA1-like [Herrania umbratica]
MRLVSLLDEEKEEEKSIEKAKVKRLNEAAMKGSVASLLELIQEDPDILNKANLSLSDTPLHVAALLGHSAFAKQLMTQKPELATDSNSQGSSPLHVAAAKGYVEIVKELLLVNPDMCLVKDRDGRTPLHLAAIKGRVEVLTELVRVRPEATRVLTGGGESALHLSVKNNHFGALKVLVESLGKDDQFVNWRDSEGSSVLHLAVAKKQLEMIKYLLTNSKMEVNVRNANGFTALDLLLHSQRDLRDMEIKECLQKAGASRMTKVQSIANNQEIEEVLPPIQAQPLIPKETDSKPVVEKHKHTDWLGRKRSALMVVASLLATVAFQASLSPPGGVWSDDYSVDSDGNPAENPHKAGLSVMAYHDPRKYEAFMILNTIAFLASLSIILLLISGLPMKRRRFMWIQMVTMWLAISAFTSTYFVALMQITPRQVRTTLFHVSRISLMIWLVMMGLVFVGNIIRMTLWLLRKYGYIKEKEKEFSLYVEEEENDE